MPSAPKTPATMPEHFQIHGQMNTDSETDRGDVNMEPSQVPAPAVTRFPPLDPQSLARDRRRVAYRQARRGTPQFEDGRERLRHFDENASDRDYNRHASFPPITTFDVRRPPTGPSSSTSMPTAPLRPTPKSPTRRPASPMRGRNERNVRQRSEDPMNTDTSDLSPEVTGQRASVSNQANYANAILRGVADLGESSEAFADTIRRDLEQYSQIRENRYLLDFTHKRATNILPPTMEMKAYEYPTVLENALLEFNLEFYRHVHPTSVQWTEFSIAILHLVAESGTLFCWTAELLRRCDTVRKEENLKKENNTYHNLFKYNRFLVYWLRHCELSSPTPGGFQRIEKLGDAGHNGLTRNFPYNSPVVLAILISCMRKSRYGVTVGVRDRYSPFLRETQF